MERYVKQGHNADAIKLLHSGAESLFAKGQTASGGDLALYMIDAMNNSSDSGSPQSEWRGKEKRVGPISDALRRHGG